MSSVRQSIAITNLSATDICEQVLTLVAGLSVSEQQQIARLLQPVAMTGSDEQKKIARCQRTLFKILLTACEGSDDRILEVMQTSKSMQVTVLYKFLRWYLLSERCTRRHICYYLAFCCTALDEPCVFRALTEGIYAGNFSYKKRSDILYASQVLAYLRRETWFSEPLFN